MKFDFKDGNGNVAAHRHLNGGGWVADTATVEASALVSGNARVHGNAQVSGDAWVSGNAQVSGNARVSGNAQVSGDAWVYGNAQVSGDAWVYGNALVYGDAWVYGNALVYGDARVYGDAQVYGNAWVYGDARVYGNAQVSGDARVKTGVHTSAPAPETKDTNPKDAVAGSKIPLWLCSPVAKVAWSLAQFAGMIKYGAWNWRISGVRSSVYLSAMQRHMDAYLSGEELDPVDGTKHLGNIMACAAILLDAEAAGKLTDDRPPVVSHRNSITEGEATMQLLKDKYASVNPKHCTISDSK